MSRELEVELLAPLVGFSEELRQPLAPIATALEVLRLRGADDCHEVGVIRREIQRLQLLVDDLVAVARLASGEVVASKDRVDLAAAATRGCELASPLLEHPPLLELPCGPVIVNADHDHLAHLVASVALAASGVRLTITSRDGHAELVATGLDPHATGLRLTLARRLTVLYGGDVVPGDAPRTLVVRIPLAPEHAANRVLIVDDNVDAANLLAEFLTDRGHVVRVAHDGPSALAVAAAYHPTVVLLDIGLPGMDGYELGARLRRDHRDVRLLAITGYGDPSDRRRSEQAGFEEHLVKPIDLDRLVRALGSGDHPCGGSTHSERGGCATV